MVEWVAERKAPLLNIIYCFISGMEYSLATSKSDVLYAQMVAPIEDTVTGTEDPVGTTTQPVDTSGNGLGIG